MPRRIDPIIWFAHRDNEVNLLARFERGLSWEEIGHQRGEVLRLKAGIANNRKA